MIPKHYKLAVLVAALPLSLAWVPAPRTGHRGAFFPRQQRGGIAASEDPVVNVDRGPQESAAEAANGEIEDKGAAPEAATFMLGDEGLSSEVIEVLLHFKMFHPDAQTTSQDCNAAH